MGKVAPFIAESAIVTVDYCRLRSGWEELRSLCSCVSGVSKAGACLVFLSKDKGIARPIYAVKRRDADMITRKKDEGAQTAPSKSNSRMFRLDVGQVR